MAAGSKGRAVLTPVSMPEVAFAVPCTEEGYCMSDLTARWVSWEPYVRSILRIMAAFCFLQFGTAKLFGFPGAMLPDGGTFPLASQAGIAGLLEAVGGSLLLVGLLTRPVAFVLS